VGEPTSRTGDADEVLHLAYAEASVVLIESLMLVLVERGVLSKDELVDALETAIETKKNLIEDGIHPHIATLAAGTLTRIANSLAAAARGRGTDRRGG
jgi:hypothetical protein